MTERTSAVGVEVDVDSGNSGVAWAAVFAGALIATAITLALIVLGTGLGLSIVSPWSEESASVTTVAISTVTWLIVMQWASAGFGGYITGRLRKRWVSLHADEVFFRDTAHGFLTWALATVLVATLAASTISGVIRTGTEVAGNVASGAAQGAGEAAGSLANPTGYFVDSLFRTATPATEETEAEVTVSPEAPTPGTSTGETTPASPPLVSPQAPRTIPGATASPTGQTAAIDGQALRAEAMRIIVRGTAAEEFPADDRQYLVQLVSDETGMTSEAAEARVDSVLQSLSDAKAETQRLAEEARENAVTLAVVTFISLLVGAFIACVSAALGGRDRDDQDLRMVVP